MTLQQEPNMYTQYDFNSIAENMNNRLFCTFTQLDDLAMLIENLTSKYVILYDKMFVLEVENHNEYVVTYNIDQGNINTIPDNTILVHRKKEHNVLYSINALNELIKTLNGGQLNNKFPIDWQNYRNSILLTQQNEFKQLNTKIYDIIEL